MERHWTKRRWIADSEGEVWLDPTYPDDEPPTTLRLRLRACYLRLKEKLLRMLGR